MEGAFLRQRIDVALDRERAGKPEVRLDLAQHRRHAVLLLMGLNKIEDLLLSFSERFSHGVFT